MLEGPNKILSKATDQGVPMKEAWSKPSSFNHLVLGSDNFSAVHPRVMDFLAGINSGMVKAYGDDPYTEKAAYLFKKVFGEQAQSYFVFTGTAANVLAVKGVTLPHEAIIGTDMSHLHEDEGGACEAFAGRKILTVPHVNGKLSPECLERLTFHYKGTHRVTPKLVTLTQATECGTVYTLDELKAITSEAKRLGLLVHMDGARLANAASYLGCSLGEMTTGVGIDLLSFGGTKNGLMCAEAIVILREGLAPWLSYIRKQGMQLASKMRYLSAQFIPYFEENLWHSNADHANQMARLLRRELENTSLTKLRPQGTKIVFEYPTEANELFFALPGHLKGPFESATQSYSWTERLTRSVTSFSTEPDAISSFFRTFEWTSQERPCE